MSIDTIGKPKWRPVGFDTIPKAPLVRPEQQEVADRLKVALAKLAEFETADELGEFLSNQGIKGVIGESGKCPVAVWLKQATGHVSVRVNYTTTAVFENVAVVYETPAVLRKFYDRFDSGFYPSLVV